MGNKAAGIRQKYQVRRKDGLDSEGERFYGAVYIILDPIYDSNSRRAAAMYAELIGAAGSFAVSSKQRETYTCKRVDGRDAPGGDRANPHYVILDITHHKAARDVALIYADSVESDGYQQLALDLRGMVRVREAELSRFESKDEPETQDGEV